MRVWSSKLWQDIQLQNGEGSVIDSVIYNVQANLIKWNETLLFKRDKSWINHILQNIYCDVLLFSPQNINKSILHKVRKVQEMYQYLNPLTLFLINFLVWWICLQTKARVSDTSNLHASNIKYFISTLRIK
jgi:hypothetical protein